MNSFWESIVTVALAILGIATIAVLVSGRAQTAGVIKAAGNAFTGAINAATSPVSGGGSYNFTGAAPGYPGFGE